MLSSFLKKLLFARQFFMIDGKIEVLGKKQVMLPANIISELESIDPELAYKKVKAGIKDDLGDYAKKLGSTGDGMLKSIEDVFETFGLGKLEVMDLNNKTKKCIVRIHNPSESKRLCSAVVAGSFSFLFSKDVDAEQTGKSSSYFEYVVK